MKQDNQNKIDFPKIGAPATRALEAAGYTRLEQLTKISEAELGQLHKVGITCRFQSTCGRGPNFWKIIFILIVLFHTSSYIFLFN